MLRKSHSPIAGHVRVTFELPACIWADRIYLAGEFNDWDETSLPLRQERDGVWRAHIDLPVGRRYEFRYIVDGKWQSDSHADSFADNEFGSSNSVVSTDVEVPPPALNPRPSLIRERTRETDPNPARRTGFLPASTPPKQFGGGRPMENAA